MKTEILFQIVEALKTLRLEMHPMTNTSVTERLDGIISKLEECLKASENDLVEVSTWMRQEVLVVLAESLQLATNLTEIIHLLLHMK
jgi:hypothetical protein